MYSFVIFAVLGGVAAADKKCTPSRTTASGSFAPSNICTGDLIFQEEFYTLNFQKWQHENTLAGGGNWEFQWYTNNRTNSFVSDGILYIKPTLTADHLGYDALYTNTLDLNGGAPADECTNPTYYGCLRTGTSTHVLNPVKSARLRTVNSFSFKYGKVQVRAKIPAGDWIWPAIWMMPRYNAYGGWPTSGEIDILESRGNRDLVQNGQNIGTQLASSTLHWGPDYFHNAFSKTHWEKRNTAGYNSDFHVYEVIWTPQDINFFIDGERTGGVTPPSDGFWKLGGFGDSLQNPWKDKEIMAPFDQEFYIIINNAVGGTNSFFPDDASNPTAKPWNNSSPHALTDFWENRNSWLSTWTLENDDAALQIDYVRVYAI